MTSKLRVIGNILPGKPAVLAIAGSMTDPCVYDQMEVSQGFHAGKVDFYHSQIPCHVLSIAAGILEYRREHQLRPFILAGYSAGGVIAMTAACLAPGQVDGLLLSNTGPCMAGHGDPKLPQNILQQWENREFRKNFIDRCFSRPVPPLLRLKLEEYIDTIDRQDAYRLSQSLREMDLREDLQKITCPVVIVHGTEDVIRPRSHAEMILKGIPQARIHYAAGGHTVMVENKAAWQQGLDELIELTAPGIPKGDGNRDERELRPGSSPRSI